MGNMKSKIDNHYELTLSVVPANQTKTCNCRTPGECPFSSRCMQSVIYQATVETNNDNPDQTYEGLTENTFKTRYANHKASFTNVSLQNKYGAE